MSRPLWESTSLHTYIRLPNETTGRRPAQSYAHFLDYIRRMNHPLVSAVRADKDRTVKEYRLCAARYKDKAKIKAELARANFTEYGWNKFHWRAEVALRPYRSAKTPFGGMHDGLRLPQLVSGAAPPGMLCYHWLVAELHALNSRTSIPAASVDPALDVWRMRSERLLRLHTEEQQTMDAVFAQRKVFWSMVEEQA